MSLFERREVVRVAGADAMKFLHGQVSQDLRPLTVGASAWSLLLEPTGKFGFVVRITREADEVFALDVDGGPEVGDAVAARLKRFLIRTKAELSRDVWVVDVGGGSDGARLVHWWCRSTEEGTQTIVDADPALVGDDLSAVLDERVRAGWPANGLEVREGGIPGETGIVDVVASFTKGCYTGQELVARIDSRANNLPRNLRRVELTGTASPGDELSVDGMTVGVVTSVAPHGPVALALVARKVDTLPAAVVVNGHAATVVVLRDV